MDNMPDVCMDALKQGQSGARCSSRSLLNKWFVDRRASLNVIVMAILSSNFATRRIRRRAAKSSGSNSTW
jgi:hypothetical protein